MTRWELLQEFHKMAKILFLEDVEDHSAVCLIKKMVFAVLTENTDSEPLKFEAGDDKIGG